SGHVRPQGEGRVGTVQGRRRELGRRAAGPHHGARQRGRRRQLIPPSLTPPRVAGPVALLCGRPLFVRFQRSLTVRSCLSSPPPRGGGALKHARRGKMTTALEKRPWARNPWRYLLWAVPAALLATPAVMMLRGAEGWLWGPLDFVFAAILLFGSTAMIDLAIRRGGSTAYRLGAALAVLVSFLLVWINAAVGVIGDEDNPANLLFFAVI